MGLLDRFRPAKIEAQLAPPLMTDSFNYFLPLAFNAVGREEAISVPSVARCRNLIAGTIATFPLCLYKKSTGEKLGKPLWLEQPAAAQPISVTLCWTVDSLIFFGVAYWRVLETYFDDGRPARFEWVAPGRVSFDTDPHTEYITRYYVDGKEVPMSGLGSLITFQGLDEGVLTRGARTLRAAIDLDKSTSVATATPMPSGVIKNTGADLSKEEVVSTQVARLMNVPAYYISADMNNSMTYANVQDERRQFVSLSLAPYLHAIQDRLSMNDITASTNIVKFDVEEAFLAVNALERLAVIEKMLTLGLISVEQAMEMENLSPNGNQDAPNVY